ncbi:hypothetical protein [Psychrobacter sp. PSP]|uniref:hypothetical protein n=1 Tax=Psychrobacter sp. PSP TaxID=2734636 RepID=UPI0020963783|nr:hypothetical protein [Psychrobacter sp. PSP]
MANAAYIRHLLILPSYALDHSVGWFLVFWLCQHGWIMVDYIPLDTVVIGVIRSQGRYSLCHGSQHYTRYIGRSSAMTDAINTTPLNGAFLMSKIR